LPAFPAVHGAKVAKLALQGSSMATFRLQSPGKATASHHVALKTTPVADIEPNAKSIPATVDNFYHKKTRSPEKHHIAPRQARKRCRGKTIIIFCWSRADTL